MTTNSSSWLWWLLAILGVTTLAISEINADEEYYAPSTKSPIKRSYVCPPNFVRLSSKCYFFSKNMATWQDAYWRCRDLHGNLAVIRNAHQDKLIRRTLSKDTLVPLERWLGGIYDWEQMAWKWAASAKNVTYNGFPPEKLEEDKEKHKWHCITIDPSLDFRWNSKSCFEQKHFVCHTKIKIVSNKEKKKLQRQYNADKSNKLNEIPVPDLPEDNFGNALPLNNNGKGPKTKDDGEEESNELRAQFARRAKSQKKRRNKGGRKGRRRKQDAAEGGGGKNATVIYGVPKLKQGKHRKDDGHNITNPNRKRRNKSRESKEASIENIRWRTYYSSASKNPLHPGKIVEEFTFSKK